MSIPAGTNASYRGSAFAWLFLTALGGLNVVRGSIHLFASDGGAGRIAGIDLTTNGDVIVSLFAAMGVAQIAFGAIDLAVALRYRSFTPLLLGLATLQQAAVVAVLWLYKPLPVAAPGKYGALPMLGLLSLAFYASLRPRAAAEQRPAARDPLHT